VKRVKRIHNTFEQQAFASRLEHTLAAELGERPVSRELGMGAAYALVLEGLKDSPEPGLDVGPWLTVIPRLDARTHAIGQALRPGLQVAMPAARLHRILLDTLDPLEPQRQLDAEQAPLREMAERERVAEAERMRELAEARNGLARAEAEQQHAARRARLVAEDSARHAEAVSRREQLRAEEDRIIAEWRRSRGIVPPTPNTEPQAEAPQPEVTP
jgi:hypothetical protein